MVKQQGSATMPRLDSNHKCGWNNSSKRMRVQRGNRVGEYGGSGEGWKRGLMRGKNREGGEGVQGLVPSSVMLVGCSCILPSAVCEQAAACSQPV